jgi:hypothetical protein
MITCHAMFIYDAEIKALFRYLEANIVTLNAEWEKIHGTNDTI